MRSVLSLALAFAVSTSGAWAQSPSRSDDDRRGGGDDYRREWREERGHHGDRGGWRDHSAMGGGMGGSGARFRLRSGDSVVSVNCGDNESMRACVDATLTLLDKLKSLPSTPAGTAPSTPPAPSPAPTPPAR